MSIDLLATVENGGCSAKISAKELNEALKDLPKITDKRLLVDIQTHDDAGVYKLSEDIALIHTTDFFPPVCSDPYEFGQIAAANSLSDVYAMGGEAVSALNLVMFPSKKLPLNVLKDILRGGHDKVIQAQAVIAGGHTIDDDTLKYGLAVTGIVAPDKIITNTGARPGDMLVLTKPLGTGIIISGKKLNKVSHEQYRAAIDTMKQLNAQGARIMQEFNIKGTTDITGFGLLGHAFKMARASNVTIEIYSDDIPFLPGAYELADNGCLPCSVFKNRQDIEQDIFISEAADFNKIMITADAQTSGGLFISVAPANANELVLACRGAGYNQARIVGRVLKQEEKILIVK
ncbi:MAG: selenide, water dikinase SelD [Candidatus Omnitrophota bacterium]|nr:selenide, water dikinase SelD [Candidatus Omnitrophota bacterium]